MEAPEWYAAWRQEAMHELVAKQEQARAAYRVGEWPRFDYSATAGTLTFSEGGIAKVVADIQIVGTTGSRDWLWSWANPHWADCAIDEMHKVRDFGVRNGIEELTTEYLEDDDLNALGRELTALAARIPRRSRRISPAQRRGSGFLVCKSYRFVS